MSLRPKHSRDLPHAVQLSNELRANPVYAHAAAVVATAGHQSRDTANIGIANVPDIAEHNALTSRVAKLEQGQSDMDGRIDRVEVRLDATVKEVKALLKRDIAAINVQIKALEMQVTGNSTKYDRVWAKLMQLEARLDKEPVEPKGFQENDTPFPRSTMGRPQGGY